MALEQRARLTRTRFWCQALAGESTGNIVVNADLTVSCNCQDYDGSGHLGDLRTHGLMEILAGPVARGFRQSLADGRLPLVTCARCHDLRRADPAEARRRVEEFGPPQRGLMVENTVACNLRCAGCFRETVAATRRRMSMTLEDLARVSACVRELGIQSVSFYNLGEPFVSRTICQELQLLRAENPEVTLFSTTNGVLLDSDAKREAALLLDSLYFSIDGASQESCEQYQRGIDFERAYENLRALVAYRDQRGRRKPEITWKYVLFRWNDRPELIQRAIELARRARVDRLVFWPTFRPLTGVSLRYFLSPAWRHVGHREGMLPPTAHRWLATRE